MPIPFVPGSGPGRALGSAEAVLTPPFVLSGTEAVNPPFVLSSAEAVNPPFVLSGTEAVNPPFVLSSAEAGWPRRVSKDRSMHRGSTRRFVRLSVGSPRTAFSGATLRQAQRRLTTNGIHR